MLHDKCAGLFGEQLLAAVTHTTHYWVSDVWLLVHIWCKQNFLVLSDSRKRKLANGLSSLCDYWVGEDLQRAQSLIIN
jgi:hypothetical protein